METYPPLVFQLHKLLDTPQCYPMVRALRWPEGVQCRSCGSNEVVNNGNLVDSARQHYRCRRCGRCFDDVSETVLAGSHQPVTHWITTLYLLNLNVSMARIALELGLSEEVVETMGAAIREGIAQKPLVELDQHVELDEPYLVAGPNGQPAKRRQAGRPPQRRRHLKGRRGCGTGAQGKSPILLLQRHGPVCLHVLPNVQRATIAPLVRATVAPDPHVYTDEYGIYNLIASWGYTHHVVHHSHGEYARDTDGDEHYEVHCNTQEGIWSLLRS